MNSMWESHDLQALLIDLGRNPTPNRLCILQPWLFVLSWVIFKLLVLRGTIRNLANLFKVKHARISVKHPSYVLQAPRLHHHFQLLGMQTSIVKRKQEEDGALHCRISRPTTKKGTASAVMAFMVSEVICHKEAFAETDSTFIATGHSIQ